MLWSIPLLLILAAILIYGLRLEHRAILAASGTGAIAVVAGLAVVAIGNDWTAGLYWGSGISLRVELTPAAAVMIMTVLVVAFPILGYAAAHEERRGLNRLISLQLFFTGAMLLLVTAADLLTLLIGWELVGLCSWALIGHQWRNAGHPDAAAHAFLITRFGDLGLFIAAAAAYAGTGSFAYGGLAGLSEPWLSVFTAGIIVSAAAKSAQLPFSHWLFKAMAGPTSVSALLHAATMVAAGVFLLIRLHPVLERSGWFAPVVLTVGLATALTAGLVAVLQPHAKKLLAASTSAQYGLMMVAVGAGFPAVALLHLSAHALFKALLFLAAGVAGKAVGQWSLAGMRLGRALPATAVSAAVGALALAAVPPLGAAWTKEAVTAAAGHSSAWLALGVVIAGGLSACYAARFQWQAYGRDKQRDENGGALKRPARLETGALFLLAGMTAALSVLWLPGVESAAVAWLGGELPPFKRWEFVASLLAIAAGLYTARMLANRAEAFEHSSRPRAAAEWLGLPVLLRHALIQPAMKLAVTAASFDNNVIDGFARRAGLLVSKLAGASAVFDIKVIDRFPVLAARLGAWCAQTGSRFAEPVLDGLAEGVARLTGSAGEDTRRLQTGYSHHYYLIVVIGATVLAAVLILGY